MGLLAVLKKRLGFKTKRTYTRRTPAQVRKNYTKRNAEYWGNEAVVVTAAPANRVKKARKRFNLEEMIFLVMNEQPHKAFTIEDVSRRLAKLRGGVRQSRASVGIRLAAMVKDGKVRRLARGFYALPNQIGATHPANTNT